MADKSESEEEPVGMMIRLPASLHARVKEAAASQHMTMNKFVIDALHDALTMRYLPLRLVSDAGMLWLGLPNEQEITDRLGDDNEETSGEV